MLGRVPLAALVILLPCLLLAQYVEGRIEVEGRFVGSMCYNSREDVVYGGSQTDNFLFAVDCSSNQVIARADVYFPRYWAYDSINNKAYLTHRGRSGECDSVLVLDGAAHTQSGSIPLDWANFTLWDPVSNRLYVSCLEENRVSVIDCAADTVIKHILTSAGPMRMHLNNRHRKLYVQCYDSERLNVIDLETLEAIENIRVPGYPEAGCYSEAADKYYCGAGQEVVVVDGTADTVVRRILVVGSPRSMVSVPARALMFVGTSYGGADTVYVIDSNGDSVVARHGGQYEPRAMVWSEASDVVYCANGYADNVTVVSGDGGRLLDTLHVGDAPFAFAYSPVQRRLYVGHLNSSKVYVIRDTVSAVAETPEPERKEPTQPTMLTRARLQAELLADPSLSLFDASGRRAHNPKSGVHFIRQENSGSQGSEGSSVRKIVIHR